MLQKGVILFIRSYRWSRGRRQYYAYFPETRELARVYSRDITKRLYSWRYSVYNNPSVGYLKSGDYIPQIPSYYRIDEGL